MSSISHAQKRCGTLRKKLFSTRRCAEIHIPYSGSSRIGTHLPNELFSEKPNLANANFREYS
jgi:hypothetical protein